MNSNPETIAKISVNVAIVALLAISAITGWRKGFGAVIFSCFRWLICIAGAFFASYPLKDFLIDKTDLQTALMAHVKTTLGSSNSGSSFFSAIPQQVRGVFESYSASSKMASTMADTLMSIIAFLLAFIILIVVTKLFEFALSRKKKDDAIGIINGLLGGAFGLIRGVFVVGLILLALFPVLTFADPEAASPIVNGIRQSEVAALLYDHNPITMLLQMF